jgi:hypothetical protein
MLVVAPAAFALVPGSMFVMTGTVQSVNCTYQEPTDLGGPKTVTCKLQVLPTGSREIADLGCVDPKVGLACSALKKGEPVLLVGDPLKHTVTHIGYWLDGAVR